MQQDGPKQEAGSKAEAMDVDQADEDKPGERHISSAAQKGSIQLQVLDQVY